MNIGEKLVLFERSVLTENVHVLLEQLLLMNIVN